ncbi:MAG: diguanylate cyclase domain-containing protein [Psychrobium sp.]
MINKLLLKLSMGQKIVALIVSVSMVSILIAITGLSINEYRAAKQRMQKEISVISDVLADNITAAVVFNDSQSAQTLLDALKTNELVEYANVVDESGQRFVDFGNERLREQSIVDDMGYYAIKTPLFIDDKNAGQLTLVVNNKQIKESIRVYLTVVVAVIFISLVFSFVLSLWVQRRFATPIIELATLASEISDTGDYSKRTETLASGEIALLQDVFNDMLAKTNDREMALEALVAERTRDLEALNKQLENQAYYDNLTKLPNRALYEDRLKQSIATANRDNTKVALMFIDLDKFKDINDTYGHAAGDELLCQVGQRLAKQCRAKDSVARIGGDEFTMLFMLEAGEDASDIARRIIDVFQVPFNILDRPMLMTMSLGVAIYPTHGQDFDVLKARADAAMYQAKQSGRNQFLIYQ